MEGETEMSEFTIIYDANGANGGAMLPQVITYGVATELYANQYTYDGYEFKGWLGYRTSDKKLCYKNLENNKRKYFIKDQQPSGWELYFYKDKQKIAQLSKKDGDTIIMYAQWECKSFLVPAVSDVKLNKKNIEKRLMDRNIVLLGGTKECINFYRKYHEFLHIHRLFSVDEAKVQKIEIDNKIVLISPYINNCLEKEDYVIVCEKVKIRKDEKYRNIKEKLKKAEKIFIEDFIRSDIAEMILDKKKLWLWFGYCQIDTLRNDIFSNLSSINSDFILTSFRYGLDTMVDSYKYEDCIELLKICDVLLYIPVVINQGKLDFSFDNLIPKKTVKITLPRIAFRGYYPYRDSDLEVFYKYSIDGKLHWPFAYQEKIIDELILAGKKDDEIYQELMREDLIPENVIQKNLKLAFKFIEISEKATDIKILDFIKENLQKRLLYRDGLHYQNFMYFEIARRIVRKMDIDCEDEINELEKNIEKKKKQLIDYTEVPILPCVVKSLKLDFVTDDTLWRVRTTEKGAWRGSVIMKTMSRKEWIYSYIEYTRACMNIQKYWNVDIEK